MAGGQERVLRRRIKSVQSTKKITKAMELISASRIVKAQQRVAAARPYESPKHARPLRGRAQEPLVPVINASVAAPPARADKPRFPART